MDADLQQMIASLSTEEEPTLSSVEARLEEIFSGLPFFMEDGDFSGVDAEEAVEAPPNTPRDVPEPPLDVPVALRNSTFWKPRRPTPYPRGRGSVSSRRQLTPPRESRRPRSKYKPSVELFSIYLSKNT